MSRTARPNLGWLLTSLVLAGCGRDLPSLELGAGSPAVDGGSGPSTALLTGLVVTPARLIVDPGTTVQLTVTGSFDDGSEVDLTRGERGTTYASSSPAIAEVDADGFVRTHTPGAVAITVRNAGLSARALIEIRGTTQTAKVVSITLSAPASISVGTRASIQVLGRRDDGRTVDLTLDDATTVEADDLTVLSVARQLIVGLAPGRSTLRAAWAGPSGVLTARAEVEVLGDEDPWVQLVFRPSQLELAPGDTGTAALFAVRASGAVEDLSSSSEVVFATFGPIVVRPGPGGVEVTASGQGRAQVTARFLQLEAALPVIIRSSGQTTSIIINAPATIREGSQAQFQVVALQSDGSAQDVTLDPRLTVVSSRPRVLDVTPGVMTGLAQGFSELDATFLGFGASATVRVLAAPDPIQSLDWQPVSLAMHLGDRPLVQLIATDLSGVQSNVSRDPATTISVFGPLTLVAVSGGYVVGASSTGTAQVAASYAGFTSVLFIEVSP